MKSHLSAVHTGLETPYTPAVPLLCPHPVCFTLNVNGSFLEEIKKWEEKRETAEQGSNCMLGMFYWAEQCSQSRTSDPAEAKLQSHPRWRSALHHHQKPVLLPPKTKLWFWIFMLLRVCFPSSSKSSKDTDTHVRFLISNL